MDLPDMLDVCKGAIGIIEGYTELELDLVVKPFVLYKRPLSDHAGFIMSFLDGCISKDDYVDVIEKKIAEFHKNMRDFAILVFGKQGSKGSTAANYRRVKWLQESMEELHAFPSVLLFMDLMLPIINKHKVYEFSRDAIGTLLVKACKFPHCPISTVPPGKAARMIILSYIIDRAKIYRVSASFEADVKNAVRDSTYYDDPELLDCSESKPSEKKQKTSAKE
jgi:hypothetical protein